MKTVLRNLFAVMAAFFMLGSVAAFAQDAGTAVTATPAADPGVMDLVTGAFNAVKSHDWRVLAATLLMAVVWAARTYGSKLPKVGPFLATDRGGAALALFLSVCGGLATAFASHAAYSFTLFADSMIVAVTAAGGWNIAKKLIAPSDKVAAPAPATPAAK